MSISPTGDRSGALAAFSVPLGQQAGEEVPIRTPVASIGRGSQNDVVLTDDSVSTMHARLEYVAGAWRLTDLDSTNGTFIESERLAPNVPTPLPYGSAVRFGAARLHFRAIEGADPDAARAGYAPGAPPPTIRERRSGVRVPVWLLVLVLLLIVAAILLFGWLWTEPSPVPPLQRALIEASVQALPPPAAQLS